MMVVCLQPGLRTTGCLRHEPDPFQRADGLDHLVWMTLNFLIVRYVHLSDKVIIPDYPAPNTVSEYNIAIPDGEEHRYTFTGPLYEFDPAQYTCGKETIFTSFGGNPTNFRCT